ncbi:thioredoxin reductase [Kushneria phosphatilytica]|nr:thioredoxin reductase [Kushneria phosphatilytica]
MSFPGYRRIHAGPVRMTHWLNAGCMLGMFMSGWGIYNASPLFGFTFSHSLTLGGWLGGNIAWHLAIMWVLVINGLGYITWGVLSRHFRHDLLPLSPRAVITDLRAALTFRLAHRLGHYNAVQKLLYLGVIALCVLVVLSGLAIWKPVQFHPLTALLGGFDTARYVHFFAMAGIGLFIAIHLVLVALVPRTLWPMISGRARSRQHEDDHHEPS